MKHQLRRRLRCVPREYFDKKDQLLRNVVGSVRLHLGKIKINSNNNYYAASRVQTAWQQLHCKPRVRDFAEVSRARGA